ncbi:discoidin domain-containing protein, partial [bacterium]|nr:discoidin domain-containing protein [bacterium]
MRTIAILSFCLLAAPSAPAADAFRSAWPADAERVWAGPEYWTNRLQDWRVAGGRLECVTSGGDRNCHLLTRELGEGDGGFRMSVRAGALGEKTSAGWAGFRIGALGAFRDYRDSCRRGKGIDCGVTTDGALFIGQPKGGAATFQHRGIPRKNWKVHFVTNQETSGDQTADKAFDGRPNTHWHSQYIKKRGAYPYEFQVDLGASHNVNGFCVLPRQDERTGRIKAYEFYVSADGKTWGQPVAKGAWPDTTRLQTVRCKPTAGRYVRLVAKSGILGDRPACVIAELFVLDPKTAKAKPAAAPKPASALPLDDLELRVVAEPKDGACTLTLSAHDPKSGKALASVRRTVPAEKLVGNLALVCHAATGGRGGQNAGGAVRFWFRDWTLDGPKVRAHDDRAFGPILWAQHTLSRGVLKMTAQMPPIGKKDAQTVRLEIQKDGKWSQVAEAPIDALARTATFRVPDWNDAADVAYRVAYAFEGRDRHWTGTVRKDPVDKDVLVVAAFTGNADYLFPNVELVERIKVQNPDLLFFSGDNIYENVGGYGCQRSPLDKAALGYLRKWYFFGWAFGDLMRDRPTISLPDDHDVYQGNVWGQGGRKCPGGINTGGYAMPAEWVKMVDRTQTSNLPDPFDPAPIEQGIGVYYCDLLYGRVSFAVLEDRKFKTGPEGVVPKTQGRSDHVSDPNFDPKTADVPGAKLLGDRQLEFLRAWAADWRGADFKAALSQTVFANAATLHGGGLSRLIADYDSNGWPQTGRNKALHELRRGYAFMIGGDQHLATLIHHG